ATTAVACASFIPLFFMGGPVGSFIRGLPTAVVLALVTSLLVAQLFTPWISTIILEPPHGTRPIGDVEPFDRNDDAAAADHHERNPILRLLRRRFGRVLPWIARHPWPVIVLFTLLLGGSLAALPKIGFQFFPKADKPILFVRVE